MYIQDTLGNFSNEIIEESAMVQALESQTGVTIQADLPSMESSTQVLLEKASAMTEQQTKKAVLAVKSIMEALGLKEDARLLTPEIATNILAWVGVATVLFKVKKNIVPVGAGLAFLYYYNNIYKKGGNLQDVQTAVIDRALAQS